MANKWVNNANSERLYFLGLQNKRCLLLGRKVMTNLDSILKSRHYFANKGLSSQSYGFSSSHVWMWELDHKKAERQRIDAFELWYWRRLLRVPWTARGSNQSILKEISPEYSLEGLMLKLKLRYFGHLRQSRLTGKDHDDGKDWRQEEKGVTEDEMVGWHHQLSGHEFEQTPGVGDRQGNLACCSPWGCKEWDTTERLNWTVSCFGWRSTTESDQEETSNRSQINIL